MASKKNRKRADLARTTKKMLREYANKRAKDAKRKEEEKLAPRMIVARALAAAAFEARAHANGHTASKMFDEPAKLRDYILTTSAKIIDDLGL